MQSSKTELLEVTNPLEAVQRIAYRIWYEFLSPKEQDYYRPGLNLIHTMETRIKNEESKNEQINETRTDTR